MTRRFPLAWLFGALLGLSVGAARADLPPPQGQTRVDYRVRITGTVGPGLALVAHPSYVSAGGSVAIVTTESELRFVQGYRPGIYSLPAADAAALVGKSGEEVDKALAEKGRVCVQEVPRVFAVATETKITAMTDVIQVDAGPEACRAALARTLYRGEGGASGEGGADAAGRRVPPAPFTDKDLPPLTGLAAASPTSAAATPPPASTQQGATPAAEKPRAGCAVGQADGAGGLAALALGLLFRSRRRPGPRAPSSPLSRK